MKEINFNFYNKKVYYDKLSNGLEIYIYQNKEVKDIYTTFTTKYGSTINSFKLNNKSVNVPNGIAHFLEHKLFEQENGIDPMNFYSKTGSNCNAMTSYDYTSYVFSCNNSFKKNIDYLLDYVQKPYFTDKNIEKEKGIIIQEINMYKDMPEATIYEKLCYNLFNNHNLKHPIIGSVDEIKQITKEDIYNCYNAFYNPNNMFITITGNVDPIKTIEIIKNNQIKKEFINNNVIINEVKEPNNVYKDYEEKISNVEIPIVAYGIKIPISNIKLDMVILNYYLNIIFDLLFDTTSIFFEECINEGLLDSVIDIDYNSTDEHKIIVFEFKSKKYKEVIKKINKVLSNIKIDENDLERRKKSRIIKLIYRFDSITAVNNLIIKNIISYNKLYENSYEIINNLNISELNDLIKNIDISNRSIYVIKNK